MTSEPRRSHYILATLPRERCVTLDRREGYVTESYVRVVYPVRTAAVRLDLRPSDVTGANRTIGDHEQFTSEP